MSPTTYTYDNGAQETFNLIRGPLTPEGYVVASFKYSDGEVWDGYVSLEWLRNRLDELAPVGEDLGVYDKMIAEAQAEATEAVTRAETAELRVEQIVSMIRIALDLPKGTYFYDMMRKIDSNAIDAEQPRPLSPDDITDEMVNRAEEAYVWNDTRGHRAAMASALAAALTEPASRPENAEDIERAMKEFDEDFEAYGFAGLADHLAEKGFQFVPDPRSYCGLGPCCLEDGHSGSCTM